MPATREVLTLDGLDEEFGEDCGFIDDDVSMTNRRVRGEAERLLLAELPDGFEIERVRGSGAGWPRGFELALFDARRQPRMHVASAARRYIGRPCLSWGAPTRLSDLETAVAFSVVLRLVAS
jgi:hypothetical protein